MSDLYSMAGAVGIERFRENTEKLAIMAGVTKTPTLDRCCGCEKMRTAATGHYSKSGKFTCGMCHRPRRVS